MPAVRFAEVELTYGCHVGLRVQFPHTAEPLVVHGPNGAGKSTLLEALVRTLFGFDRRTPPDRDRVAARTPWSDADFAARLVLSRSEGRFEVARAFTTEEVTVHPPADEGAVWRGDGNPASSNEEARQFRARLRELFGFADRESYEATACLSQGAILETRLNDSLLQLAAGGHGNVDEALQALRARHGSRTRQPIAPGMPARRKERELERARAERSALEAQLREAEAAVRRRTPIQARLEELRAQESELRSEVALLEAAQGPLAERRALRAERDAAEASRHAFAAVRRKVEEARRRFASAREAAAELEPGSPYPSDFPERLSRLDTLWLQRQEAEVRRSEAERALAGVRVPPLVPLGVAGGAISGLLALVLPLSDLGAGLAWVIRGLLWASAGALLVGAAFGWDRARSRRDRLAASIEEAGLQAADVSREIERTVDDIPHGESLRPSNAAERRERFERERGSRARLVASEDRLAGALEEAHEALGLARAGLAEGEDVETAAEAVVERLAAREEELRTEKAIKELQLRESESGRLELPAGVEAALDAVQAALSRRRASLERVHAEVGGQERSLFDQGTPGASPVALADRLLEIDARIRELQLEVRVLERAYALVCEAYESFRERDEERLLAHVSRRMSALSGGVLGPVEAGSGLAHATVRLRGKAVPLGSPPLSYGEYHAALLGIRLGATDFLSAAGIRPPLIVDDPFVHLDEERAVHLWQALRAAAADRQVIVATQDRLLVEHLGIDPDLHLQPRGAPEAAALYLKVKRS